MSPIRPENRDRYPADWPAISLAIKERGGWQCECLGECGRGTHEGRCPNLHGEPAYGTGSKVVLTTAHLVSATHLPVELRVTRATQADQIVELVGALVPVDPERLEGDDVMHNRALAEFLATAPATGASFAVALPCSAARSLPGGPVVPEMATRPVWVVLTGWRLSRPPGEAADVPAEAPPCSQVVTGHAVFPPAPLASADTQRSLRPTYEFSATGFRASSDVIRRLLRRDQDYLSADGALDTALASSLCAADAGALDARMDARTESPFALGGTGLPGHLGVVREFDSADDAGQMSRAKSRSGHAPLYHLGYLPENCDPANLRAMCQGCHLHYDRDHHKQTAAATRRAALAAQGQGELWGSELGGAA